MPEEIQLGINDEYMTLGQLLKLIGLISTGGQAKWFLEENTVYVNDQLETRRGKKLIDGDKINIVGHGSYLITKST